MYSIRPPFQISKYATTIHQRDRRIDRRQTDNMRSQDRDLQYTASFVIYAHYSRCQN